MNLCQTERGDMLEAIRQLTQNIRLKDMIIANFIPEDMARNIEKRAVWSDEDEAWVIQVRSSMVFTKAF